MNSHRVVADESQKQCPICGEKFEDLYDEHEDEWVYKDTTIVGGKIYHYSCFMNSQPREPDLNAQDSINDEESENEDSESEEEPTITLNDENVNIPSKRSLDESLVSSTSTSEMTDVNEREEQELKRAKVT